MTQHATSRLSTPDIAARFIVTAAGLSLNDVASNALNIGQAVSLAIFASAITIIVLTRSRLSPSLIAFAAAILSYLSIGGIFSVANGADFLSPASGTRSPAAYLQSYSASILILWSIAIYVASLTTPDRASRFLRYCRNVFVLTTAAILLSPILEPLFPSANYTSDFRMRGLFSNPNEAAQAALFALALCIFVPPRRTSMRSLFLGLTSCAVAVTLSKGAIVLLILTGGYLALRRGGIGRALLATLSVCVVLVALQNAGSVFEALVTQHWIPIPESQHQRILSIGALLDGRVDAATTTGRTLLWQLSLERIGETFPAGSGLGTFHHLEGGLLEANIWQGSHNVFLMVLGESGPIPLLLLILALVIATSRSLQLSAATREFCLLSILFLTVFWMSGHTGLAIRFHDFILALVIGLGTRSYTASPKAAYPHRVAQ